MEVCTIEITDDVTAPTVGVGKRKWRVPYEMTLVAVRAQLVTPQASGNALIVDVNKDGASILATKLSIDNGKGSSKGAVVPAVISDGVLPDDCEISIDIDQIGDGTAKGLKVTLYGYRPPAASVATPNVPPPAGGVEQLIDRSLGSHFGDLTVFGLGNAFDGVTNAAGASCAAKSGSGGYLGTSLPTAKILKRALVYGANDRGFCDAANPSVTITIYGKNGSNPTGPTDGTAVGQITFTDTTNESAGREIVSTNISSSFTRLWAYINGGPYSTYCAEVVFYEWVP